MGGVQLAAREPLVEGRLGLVEHRVPALEPVERLGLLGPPRLRVARGLLVDRLVADQRLLRELLAAARRAPGRGARRSRSRAARTRSWCSLPYPGFYPTGRVPAHRRALEPAPEERACKRDRRVARSPAPRRGGPGARPGPRIALEAVRVGGHLAPLARPARAAPRDGTEARSALRSAKAWFAIGGRARQQRGACRQVEAVAVPLERGKAAPARPRRPDRSAAAAVSSTSSSARPRRSRARDSTLGAQRRRQQLRAEAHAPDRVARPRGLAEQRASRPPATGWASSS